MYSTTNNTHQSFPADIREPNPSSGVYQLTTVGASDATSRTFVPVPISALYYLQGLYR